MVWSCVAMGRSSDDATNACFRRAVLARRSAGVPRCRVLCAVAFFFDVVEACFFVVVPELLEPSPEVGTAATRRQINPTRQALPSLEGKNGEICTLIHSMYAGFGLRDSAMHQGSHFRRVWDPGSPPGPRLVPDRECPAPGAPSFRMDPAAPKAVNHPAEFRNQLAWRPSNP